ncbi:hypothetical protein KKF84_20280, partial [Myxococcota bacterium]|nr:hypothetical protein [Myxococcota bacterium]
MKNIIAALIICSVFSACDDKKGDTLCGNGMIDTGEECDATALGGHYCDELGFYGGILACSSDCTLDLTGCEAMGRCGDRIVQGDYELCDGTPVDVTQCGELGFGTGLLSCGADCHYDLSDCTGAVTCGNTLIESHEQCDGANLGGYTCDNLAGFIGGELFCGSDCFFDTTLCYRELICGDGLVRGDEQCDAQNLRGLECEDVGYEGGTLQCSDSCVFDFSQCTGEVICGDGVINGEEECDDIDLDGVTCANTGYYGGTLECNPDCTLDFSSCEAFGKCGDGVIQVTEEFCDGENLGGITCQDLGYYTGEVTCGFNCTLDDVSCDGFCGNASVENEFGEM